MPHPPGPSGTPVIVGLDLGTTTAKAVAYDEHSRVWADVSREYPLHTPRPGYAEQDPGTVCDAALDVVTKAVAQVRSAGGALSGVALSAAMHSLLALDENGAPLTPALTYADSRAAAEASRLRHDPAGIRLGQRTGTPLHPMSPLAKLLWFREHDRVTFDRATSWVSLKELLLRRLCGETVVDHSLASASGLFNLRERNWDADALRLTSVDAGQLSRPVPTTTVLTGLDPAEARRCDLPADLRVVVGAADGCLANLGVGATAEGIAACTIGTSGAVRVATTTPDTDPHGRLFTYALTDDRWIVGGPISNGGLVLRWLRDAVLTDLTDAARGAGVDPYERMTAMAADVPAGSEGLLFLPYLTGERAPDWNASARGALLGLTLRHGRGHLIRSAMEGVLLQLRAVVEAMGALQVSPSAFRATGGFTDSPLWLQMMADVFRREIGVPDRAEGTALGAALLGMVALGTFTDIDEAAATVTVRAHRLPDAQTADVYDAVFDAFRASSALRHC
ncbi:MAG: gluconokinase [Euzebyaceae bacterium]|nr:gluconokinase [Euzebyaceae bacterium]